MTALKKVQVPDIGDFTDVEIVEVMVASGDTVAVDDSLIMLETDKAVMDVPTPYEGTVKELLVGVGDRVGRVQRAQCRERGDDACAQRRYRRLRLRRLAALPQHLDHRLPRRRLDRGVLVRVLEQPRDDTRWLGLIQWT